MSIARKVAQNTGIIISANAIIGLLGVITTVCMVRYLGADRFGALSFILTYVGFFAIITELVATQIVIREISRDSSAEVLAGNVIMIKIVLSVCAVFLSCAAINLFSHPLNTKALACIASLGLFLSFGSVYAAVFRSRLRMVYPMAVDVLTSALKLAAVLFLIHLKASLGWFVLAIVSVALPGLVINMLLSGRLVRPQFSIDFGLWKRLIVESWPVVLTSVFVMIYLRIDQIMLFQIKGPNEVGYYAAAVKLIEVFGIIPSAFMISAFPAFSSYFITSAESLEKAYRASFRFMATIILPIAVGLFIVAAPVARIVYGEKFLACAEIIKILIWSDIFIFLGMVHSNLLVAIGLQKIDLIFAVINAAVNVAINIILIPRYGMTGAAIATLISYGSWIPLAYILKKTRPYTRAMISSAVRPAIAAGMMGVCVYSLFSAKAHLAAVILTGMVSYTFFIFVIKGIRISDFQILKR